jgi:hypothetical protein
VELKWGEHQEIAAKLSEPPLDLVVAADCLYEEDQVQPFVQAIFDLCTGANTVAWVSFERRTELVRNLFYEKAGALFSMQQLSLAKLPEDYRSPHVELWELRKKQQAQAQAKSSKRKKKHKDRNLATH